jgi:hypothetical protein
MVGLLPGMRAFAAKRRESGKASKSVQNGEN